MLFYIEQLRDLLSPLSNSERGEAMSAYMKNKFPFLGIAAPDRKSHIKPWIQQLNKEVSPENRSELIRELWALEEREYQYCAIDWMLTWKKNSWQKEDIELLQWIITQKSWWDTVDLIASHSLGTYFRLFPNQIIPVLDRWDEDDSFWLHRSGIIFQLKYKEHTDLALLYQQIEKHRFNKEFFIQKAIGWSLRQISLTQSDWVKNTVETLGLVGLAKKEALRKMVD